MMQACKKVLTNVQSVLDRNWKLLLIILLLIQIIISAVLFVAYGGFVVSNDTSGYTEPAINFIETGKFLDGNGNPMLFRTPGYPAFLAVIYLFGGSNTIVSVIQLFMMLSASIFIFMTIKTLTKTNWAGTIAVIFYTFDFIHYFYSINICSDILFTYLIILSAFFLVKWIVSGNKWTWFLLSVLSLQLAGLVKTTLLYYVILITALIIVLTIIKKLSWKCLAIYLSVFIICFCGWCARNYYVSGYFMLSNVRYTQFYYYDGPGIMMDIENITQPEAEERFAQLLEQKFGDTSGMSEMQLAEYQKVIGNDYVFSHFGEFLKSNLQGLFPLLLGPGVSPLNDIIDNGIVLNLIYIFNSGLLSLLYLIYAVSFLIRLKRVTWFEWLNFITICYLIAATASLGYSRYRLAFYPLLLIGAMVSLVRITDKKSNSYKNLPA